MLVQAGPTFKRVALGKSVRTPSTGAAKMRRVFLIALALLPTPVLAAKATCREFTASTGADRALMDGFILGFVAARMEGRPSAEVDATTMLVRERAAKFCASHPDERAIDVLGGLGDIATGYVAPR